MGKLAPKTVHKLASLSALGAGALALTPQNLDASMIYYTTPIPLGVGQSWLSGQGSSTPLPGGPQAQFGFSVYLCGCGHQIDVNAFPNVHFWFNAVPLTPLGAPSTVFAPFLKLVNSNAVQNSLYYFGGIAHSLYIATFGSNGGVLSSGGQKQFSNQFALFSFQPTAGATDFGWVELSLTAGANPLTAQLTIDAYAFDDSGLQVYAGGGAVPEPGTFGSTAMAALALGAVGLRRWRAGRKKSAQ